MSPTPNNNQSLRFNELARHELALAEARVEGHVATRHDGRRANWPAVSPTPSVVVLCLPLCPLPPLPPLPATRRSRSAASQPTCPCSSIRKQRPRRLALSVAG